MLSSSETKHSSSTIVNTLTSSSVISENTAPLNQENVSGKAAKSSQPADVVKTSSINVHAVTSAHSLEATPVKTSSQVVPAVTSSQVTPSQDVVTSSQTTMKSSQAVATSSQALVTSSQAVATSSQAVVTTSKVVVMSSEGVVTSSQALVTSSQAVVMSSQAMLVVVPDQQRFKVSSRVMSSGHVGVGMAPTPSSSTAKPAEVATPTVTPRILETSSVATLKVSFSSTVRVDSSSSIVSARLSLPAALPVNDTSTADVSPGATSVRLTFSSVAATTPPIMPLDKSQYFSFTSYCNVVDHITTSALNALSFFVCLFVFCKLQKRRHWF